MKIFIPEIETILVSSEANKQTHSDIRIEGKEIESGFEVYPSDEKI